MIRRRRPDKMPLSYGAAAIVALMAAGPIAAVGSKSAAPGSADEPALRGSAPDPGPRAAVTPMPVVAPIPVMVRMFATGSSPEGAGTPPEAGIVPLTAPEAVGAAPPSFPSGGAAAAAMPALWQAAPLPVVTAFASSRNMAIDGVVPDRPAADAPAGQQPFQVPGRLLRSRVVAPHTAPDLDLKVNERTTLGLFGELAPNAKVDPRTINVRKDVGAGLTLQYKFPPN